VQEVVLVEKVREQVLLRVREEPMAVVEQVEVLEEVQRVLVAQVVKASL
jgi:hypothetical protein